MAVVFTRQRVALEINDTPVPAFDFGEEFVAQFIDGVDIEALGLARAHSGICKSEKAPSSFKSNDFYALKITDFKYFNEEGNIAFEGDFNA